MHVLVVADGRSPHTHGWIRGMTDLSLTVSLLSSRRMEREHVEKLVQYVPATKVYQPADLWNRTRRGLQLAVERRIRGLQDKDGRASQARAPHGATSTASLIARADLWGARAVERQIGQVLNRSGAQVVHALRIQCEGIAAATARRRTPVAVSSWGQDLTSTPRTSEFLAVPTKKALSHTDVLFADCIRDVDLAPDWGLRDETPRFVVPGNFGVDLDRYPDTSHAVRQRYGLENRPLVVYPRGVRPFVNYWGFVDAVRRVLNTRPDDAVYLGVGLAGVVDERHRVAGSFECSPVLEHADAIRASAAASVVVSPAWTDGMPNSVLEGMAGGAIPVCGDIESLRELERHGGVVVWCDPSDSGSIAAGVTRALDLSHEPRNRQQNRDVIRRHYSVAASQARAREAYVRLEALVR